MGNIEVILRITYGSKTVESIHQLDGVAGEQAYPIIRELVRQAADAGARAFPNPRSPYSDDLFKVSQQGVVSNVVPKQKDEDDIDFTYPDDRF